MNPGTLRPWHPRRAEALARLAAGESRQEIAKDIGVTAGAIWLWKQGPKSPPPTPAPKAPPPGPRADPGYRHRKGEEVRERVRTALRANPHRDNGQISREARCCRDTVAIIRKREGFPPAPPWKPYPRKVAQTPPTPAPTATVACVTKVVAPAKPQPPTPEEIKLNWQVLCSALYRARQAQIGWHLGTLQALAHLEIEDCLVWIEADGPGRILAIHRNEGPRRLAKVPGGPELVKILRPSKAPRGMFWLAVSASDGRVSLDARQIAKVPAPFWPGTVASGEPCRPKR